MYNPANGININVWERMGDTFWFTAIYEETATAEFKRVTGHEVDTIPICRYGFFLWENGGMYHITQQK